MRGWTWLWVAVLGAWTIAAAIDDYREDGALRSARGLLSGAACIVCLVAYVDAEFAGALGRALLLVAASAGIAQAIELYEDLRDLPREDASLAPLAVALVALAFGGPIAMGAIRGLEAW